MAALNAFGPMDMNVARHGCWAVVNLTWNQNLPALREFYRLNGKAAVLASMANDKTHKALKSLSLV